MQLLKELKYNSIIILMNSFSSDGVLSSVVEHLTADQEVTGSNPVGPSKCFLIFHSNKMTPTRPFGLTRLNDILNLDEAH